MGYAHCTMHEIYSTFTNFDNKFKLNAKLVYQINFYSFKFVSAAYTYELSMFYVLICTNKINK